jgi:hypothetical protein
VVREEHYFRMGCRSDRQRERAAEELKFIPTWVPAGSAVDLLTYEPEKDWARKALAARSLGPLSPGGHS